MNALLLRDAAIILNVTPERMFYLAHLYGENMVNKKSLIKEFLTWYHENKLKPGGDVENFVLDVLAGRVQPTKLLK